MATPRRRPPALTSLGARAAFLGYKAGSAVANALPAPIAGGLARSLAVPFALGLRSRRLMIGRHLQRVYGGSLSGWDLEVKITQAFDSYARYWMESFRLSHTDRAGLEAGMSWEGVGHVEAGYAAGNGVLMALPHLGGWDFGGAWFASAGYPATVVVESLEPPELFEWFAELRRHVGLTVVPHGPAAGPAVLKALKRNELVGLVCDRDLERSGVQVEFFGERTTLPAGPATLALRTGAVLLPTAVYFQGSGHHGIVRPPIPVERSGDGLRADVARITQLLASELEALIRRAPEQWHLLQPNWPSDYALLAGRGGTAPLP
ncbi:MAG TPA: phosphatidylinositol mannoside acyltransferase [Acidimicrobiales bacterium]|nr:phosphatidylinositol mannoside acyltransferase [Acidimicrobiales bacterium]